MIGWDDGLGQVNDVKWLYDEKLIPRLVTKLDPTYEKEEEVQVNAARALVDVVVKCPPAQTSLLVSHLQSAPILERIFRYMFSGSRSSLTNCLSIIIVLVQRDANRRSELQQDEHLDAALPPIIEQVLKHLPQLASLLTKPPDAQRVLLTQYGQLNPPLGETRMKAVELFLVLFRSNYGDVNQKLAELKVVPSILDLFFQYEWNNMLHGLVESIIRTILESESFALKQSLFVDGKFVDRVLSAYKKNEGQALTRPPSSKKGGFRIGYMGHLVRTCGAIAFIFNGDAKTKALLGEQQKSWDDFVQGALAKDNESHNAMLGGAAPTFAPEDEDRFEAEAGGVPPVGGGPAPVAGGVAQPSKDDDLDDTTFDDDDGNYGSAYALRTNDEDDAWSESLGLSARRNQAGAPGSAGHDDDDSSDDDDASRKVLQHGSDEDEDGFDPRAAEAAKAKNSSGASEKPILQGPAGGGGGGGGGGPSPVVQAAAAAAAAPVAVPIVQSSPSSQGASSPTENWAVFDEP